MRRAGLETPVGRIVLTEEDGHITALDWGGALADDASPLLDEARRQIDAYFGGTRRAFTLPMAPRSSPFQHLLFEALMAIRFGETRSYGRIARMLDASPQAVGQACGANPIPILIPCHRVLASDGGLGGYSGAGGVETKIALLRHEGAAGLLI
ncbi:cysteine methyltransferase [Maritimibacter sp. 55A14]|nr:methylated-DNA--[protein]-cysteine S-methyltransferase [Maritimibacter sp. 55A14]PWE32203.1 cysteine methyltransferase [Maritimibacter sp. 55A14]